MATIRCSNWVAPQKGTPAGTRKSTSALFPRSLRHMWVIKQGTQNTWGRWGCARLSSHKSLIATSIAAGGSIQSLAALTSLSSNMLWGPISCNGRFPQSRP
jgi:hypothetical protein